MKKIISIILFSFICSIQSQAQWVGIGLEMEMGWYQWHKRPDNIFNPGASSGQILSFPAVGPKIWFGDWEMWTISIESKVDYSVFAVNIGEKSGFGTLSFPTLIKGNFNPFGVYDDSELKNSELKIGIGLGTQWIKSGLHHKPDRLSGLKNPFFMTYIAELSFQIVIGTDRINSDRGFSLEFFSRPGWGKNGARSFTLGMKLGYRINYGG